MHKVIINKLGPIKNVELYCNDFMVFTGAQASGKSTIAKTIFFFRTIKDDILSLMIKKVSSINGDISESLNKALETELRDKFMRVFGSSWGMKKDMYIEYHFNADTSIKVYLKEETVYSAPNYIWIEYSDNVRTFLNQSSKGLSKYPSSIPDDEKNIIKNELNELFSDRFESVYIPAGRSLITLLATQLNYIYSTMEDAQKKAIDFCTRSYLERILKIRPEFENGLQGLFNSNPMKSRRQKDKLDVARNLINEVLKGLYRYNGGDERLEIQDNQYVKINFMSSCQQEVVWFLNLFYYHLLQGQPTYFIIEEPESHLFPESQKAVSEFISFVKNVGNNMLVTTHSPYVLGSFNNLLYAAGFSKDNWIEVEKVIDKRFWINHDTFDAIFVQDGHIISGMDKELNLINNELIDDISRVINDTYDKLFEIRTNNEEAGE